MKKEHLIILGAILAVLLVFVVVKQVSRDRPTITEQVNLTRLVPAGTEIGDVERIEMYLGSAPQDKVVLERVSGSEWRTASLFNAPAKEEKLSDFLKILVELQGEFRAEAQAQQVLERYELTDETAFHVVGYGESEDPLFHLLNGKSPSPEQTFMRVTGGEQVFVESANLRREAGLWSGDATDPPKSETWADMTVTDFEQDDVMSYRVTTPVKSLAFEKREVPAEEDDAGEEAEPEYEWVLVEGGPAGLEFKESGLRNAVRSAARMDATTIVDPAQRAEWGLEPAGYRVELQLAGEEEPVAIEGGRPEGADEGYVSLPNDAAGLVYEVSRYAFEQAFAKGSNLFDLPAPGAEAESIVRMEIERPDVTMVFEKTGGEWAIVEPDIGLGPMDFALSDLATSLAEWKPADYAGGASGAVGLEEPAYTVRFTVEDAAEESETGETASETHVIEIGAETPAGLGRYARYNGGETVLVLSPADFDKIVKDPNDVYDLSLIDASSDGFASIEVNNAGAAFTLTRSGEAWQVTTGGETLPADASAASDVAYHLSRFQPEAIVFGQTALPGEQAARITAATADGATYELAFGPAADGSRLVRFGGQVFRASADELTGLFVTPESLVAAETLEEEESPGADAADAAPAPEMEAAPAD